MKLRTVIPTVLVKQAYIDSQKIINETAVGNFKPYDALHTGGLGAALGGLATGATSFIGDTAINQFRGKKKSTLEKIKTALLLGLLGAGGGGALGGYMGNANNKRNTDQILLTTNKKLEPFNSQLSKNPRLAKVMGLEPINLGSDDKDRISEGISNLKLNQLTENPNDAAKKELFENIKGTSADVLQNKGRAGGMMADKLRNAEYEQYASVIDKAMQEARKQKNMQ
jgi:hypothetical protein